MSDTRVSYSESVKRDMKKCSNCHAYKERDMFKKGDKYMRSCIECRRKYMQQKELKCDSNKLCSQCNITYPINMFLNSNGKWCISCKDCRKAYIDDKNKLDLTLPTLPYC